MFDQILAIYSTRRGRIIISIAMIVLGLLIWFLADLIPQDRG